MLRQAPILLNLCCTFVDLHCVLLFHLPGERGVNVSGGQKQRIAIARAVYSGADIFLFDDPLSALDAKVGRKVFNRCIAGQLKHKTRVLVTNQLQYVNSADMVVFMHEGKVAEMGTFTELVGAGRRFANMMAEAQVQAMFRATLDMDAVILMIRDELRMHKQCSWMLFQCSVAVTAVLQDKFPCVECCLQVEEGDQDVPETTNSKENGKTQQSGMRKAAAALETRPVAGGPAAPTPPKDAKESKLIEVEKRSTGIVSRVVLWAYVKAMGGLTPFLILMTLFLLVEILRALATVWLSYWTGEVASMILVWWTLMWGLLH